MKKIFSVLLFFSIANDLISQNSFPSSGNVGIGVSPAFILDIGGSGTSGSNSINFKWAAGSSGYGPNFNMFKSRGTLASPTTVNNGDGLGTIIFGGYDGTQYLNAAYIISNVTATPGVNSLSSNLVFSTNNGSSSPTTALTIAADHTATFTSTVNSPSFNAPLFNAIRNDGNMGIGITNGIDADLQINTTIGGEVTKYASIAPSGATNLILNKNGGNIGIGTTNPYEKLTVDGNIVARKIRITQTGWSDYVFDKNYPLKPIYEVAKFIKQNKHLPDIPSAKEVEENGISLGETQALLLKKIEELTLYVIELNKQNRTLQESNLRLNLRMSRIETGQRVSNQK